MSVKTTPSEEYWKKMCLLVTRGQGQELDHRHVYVNGYCTCGDKYPYGETK